MKALDRLRKKEMSTGTQTFSLERTKARLSQLMVNAGLPVLPPSAGGIEKTYSFPTYRQAMKACAAMMDGFTLDGWKFEIVEPKVRHLQWTLSGDDRKVCASVGLDHANGKACLRIFYFEV